MQAEVLQQQLTSLQHQLEMRQAMLQQASSAQSRSKAMAESPRMQQASDPDGVAHGLSSPRSRGSSFLLSSLSVSPSSK